MLVTTDESASKKANKQFQLTFIRAEYPIVIQKIAWNLFWHFFWTFSWTFHSVRFNVMQSNLAATIDYLVIWAASPPICKLHFNPIFIIVYQSYCWNIVGCLVVWAASPPICKLHFKPIFTIAYQSYCWLKLIAQLYVWSLSSLPEVWLKPSFHSSIDYQVTSCLTASWKVYFFSILITAY